MKKGLALLTVLLLAAAPSAVLAKKHSHMHHAKHAMAEQANPNANTSHFLGDGLHQLVVPFDSAAGATRTAMVRTERHKRTAHHRQHAHHKTAKMHAKKAMKKTSDMKKKKM